MITCREVADYLMQYLDRELPEFERREFERHLEVCPPCVRYLESYEKTVELAKDAFVDQPENIPEALVAAILAARKRN